MASLTSGRRKVRAGFKMACLLFIHNLYSNLLCSRRQLEDAGDLVLETFRWVQLSFSSSTSGTNYQVGLFAVVHSIFLSESLEKQRDPNTLWLRNLAVGSVDYPVGTLRGAYIGRANCFPENSAGGTIYGYLNGPGH